MATKKKPQTTKQRNAKRREKHAAKNAPPPTIPIAEVGVDSLYRRREEAEIDLKKAEAEETRARTARLFAPPTDTPAGNAWENLSKKLGDTAGAKAPKFSIKLEATNLKLEICEEC